MIAHKSKVFTSLYFRISRNSCLNTENDPLISNGSWADSQSSAGNTIANLRCLPYESSHGDKPNNRIKFGDVNELCLVFPNQCPVDGSSYAVETVTTEIFEIDW